MQTLKFNRGVLATKDTFTEASREAYAKFGRSPGRLTQVTAELHTEAARHIDVWVTDYGRAHHVSYDEALETLRKREPSWFFIAGAQISDDSGLPANVSLEDATDD